MKTWAHGKTLRSDSMWQDDRYNPTVYKHPHRNDAQNNPAQEYSDFFGGTHEPPKPKNTNTTNLTCPVNPRL